MKKLKNPKKVQQILNILKVLDADDNQKLDIDNLLETVWNDGKDVGGSIMQSRYDFSDTTGS